jgi:hypothetical protein
MLEQHPESSRAERLRPYRWKPGQSGNPGGRPKNDSITSRLRRVLASEHNGREIADLIAERLIKEALSGKFPFLKELLDRTEGAALERHRVTLSPLETFTDRDIITLARKLNRMDLLSPGLRDIAERQEREGDDD